MKYLFILGRNPKLSVAEIFSFLKRVENKVEDSKQIKNALLLDLKNELDEKSIESLGGTISIGKVLCLSNEKDLEKQNIYLGTKNKINYAIWNFSSEENYEFVSAYLKKRFRAEKLKASEKPLSGKLEMQGAKNVRITSGLIDEEYFVFEDLFGKIIEKSDYEEIERRDMEKPTRREALAISPRLAKIMINLSEVKSDETLVDPFCGIGVILSEALLQGLDVVGIDIDPNAIAGAKNNLEWLNFSKDKYKLIVGNSKKTNVRGEGIATEPDLGETLKRTVSKRTATNILQRFEKLMIGVLRNFKHKINGKIVFSAPYILLFNKKRVGCKIDLICENTGLKLVSGGFDEYRKGQVVGRQIFVLE